MKLPFRNGILNCTTVGPKNTPGYIVASGDRAYAYDLICTEPFAFTIAHGSSNYVSTIPTTVQSAWWGAKPGSSLLVEMNASNGAVSFITAAQRIQHTATNPVNPLVGQYVFNTTSCKTLMWMGSNWVERLVLEVGYITDSGAVVQYGVGTMANLVGAATGGWLLVDENGKTIRKQNKEYVTAGDEFYISGSPTKQISLETGLFMADAIEPIPEFSFVVVTEGGSARLANYTDIGVHPIGMSMSSGEIGEIIRVLFGGTVTNHTWNFRSQRVWVGANGAVTTTQPNSTGDIKPCIGYAVGPNTMVLVLR